MNYLFYGEDNTSKQKKINDTLDVFVKKGHQIVHMDDSSFDEGDFLNEILSNNLFGEKRVLVLHHCLLAPSIRDFLEHKKEEIIETETPLVFVESKFLKKDFPSFKKSFDVVSEHKSVAKKEGQRFNVFPLIDAIVSGDKKNGWLLFRKALDENVSVEEIINLLFWQFKTLTLVSTGLSAGDLGMKPFVYSKSKRLLSRYSRSVLIKKMFELLLLFQESRFEKDSAERFEKFILS